jgi:hypothetical protein
MFRPHEFKKTIVGLDTPKIIIQPQAFQDMGILVSEMATEVGWLVTVKRPTENLFLLENVYLFKQGVHAATTEISAAGISDVAAKLIEENPETGVDEVNSLRCWVHSHVNMGVEPSGQDDSQMSLFNENGCEWFLRGIMNKAGMAKFDLFYFKQKYKILDIPWEIGQLANPDRVTFWKNEIKDKVTEITYGSHTTGTSGYVTDNYMGVPFAKVTGKGNSVYAKCSECGQRLTISSARDMWTWYVKCPHEDCKKKMQAQPENYTLVSTRGGPYGDWRGQDLTSDRRDWSGFRDKGGSSHQEVFDQEDSFCPKLDKTSPGQEGKSSTQETPGRSGLETTVITVSSDFKNANPIIQMGEAFDRIADRLAIEGPGSGPPVEITIDDPTP